jgi:hypothetical protein
MPARPGQHGYRPLGRHGLHQGSGSYMLTNPLIYSAIIAVCTLGREIVRCRARHRDIALLIRTTQDPRTLHYLIELEKARHLRLIRKPLPAEGGPEPPFAFPSHRKRRTSRQLGSKGVAGPFGPSTVRSSDRTRSSD